MSPRIQRDPRARGRKWLEFKSNMGRISLTVMAAVFLPILFSAPLRAQSEQEQITALREEVNQLRQELDALKADVHHNRAQAASAAPSPSQYQAAPARYQTAETQTETQPGAEASQSTEAESSAADVVPMLQSEVADQAQTKIESNSKLPVKLFGTVVAGAFYNTNEGDWRDVTTTVDSPPAAGLKPGSFNATLRQSRVGAIVSLPDIGSMKATGMMAMDFFGGAPDIGNGTTIGTPRLLYAYVRLQGKQNAIEVGQDEMIFAPGNPTSIASYAIPEFYRTGNLYLRVPQARIEHDFGTGKNGEFLAVAGILAPASAYGYGGFSGANTRQPAVQARVAWRSKPANPGDEPGLEIGFSGHYGHEVYFGQPLPSSGGALDFNANHGRLGFGGKMYLGQNLGAMGGAIGQAGRSEGGFMEGRLHATPKLEFNAGVGTDQVIRGYNTDPTSLRRNNGLYANTIFRFTPELATSFEYRWLSTTPVAGPQRNNNHIDMVFAYSF